MHKMSWNNIMYLVHIMQITCHILMKFTNNKCWDCMANVLTFVHALTNVNKWCLILLISWRHGNLYTFAMHCILAHISASVLNVACKVLDTLRMFALVCHFYFHLLRFCTTNCSVPNCIIRHPEINNAVFTQNCITTRFNNPMHITPRSKIHFTYT